MAGASIEIRPDSAAAETALGQLLARARDLKPAYEEIGSILVTRTQERFESQTGPDGRPWTPFAPSTLRRRLGKQTPKKGRRGGGAQLAPQLLRDTARLYRSLTYQADADGVAAGTNVKYAALQQFGGTPGMAPGAAAVPARPFLGLSPDDASRVTEVLTDYLAGPLGA